MIIEKLKQKLFDQVKEHDLALFHGLPNSSNRIKYYNEGNDIEDFINFAIKVGVKVIYYDLDYFEEEGSEKKLVGLSVHFNYKRELYRFHWEEDWYYNKLKEDAKKEKIKEEEEMYEIIPLQQQSGQSLMNRFDCLESRFKDIENLFLELVNVLQQGNEDD